MTDFIHEHPKDESPTPPPTREEPPLDEKTGQKRVYGYIFILFIVAFSLLLWSYMMNQRSNDQVLSELRGNASAMQTAVERNVELEKQVDELQAALDKAEQEKAALEKSAEEQQEMVDMLNRDVNSLSINRDICYALLLMEDGDHQDAAVMLTSWYSTADILAQIEANDTGSWNDGEPPVPLRERYEAMVEQLVKEGYLTVMENGQLKSWHIDQSDESR